MAIIKQLTLRTKETCEYWVLDEINNNKKHSNSICTIYPFKTKADRMDLSNPADPLNISYQFVFTNEEIGKIENIVKDLAEDWVDLWYHCHYVKILEYANQAHDKRLIDPNCILENNETLALFFYGAVSDL